jgi:hypothetical protein
MPGRDPAEEIMSTSPANDRAVPRRGHGAFWAGIALSLLGIALTFVQYNVLKQTMMPWYAPALATLGACLLLYSVIRRPGVIRVIALLLFAALAALEWYAISELTRLPEYKGPARAGAAIPAFETTLADGRPFTDEDLGDGKPSVFTFFRGRW